MGPNSKPYIFLTFFTFFLIIINLIKIKYVLSFGYFEMYKFFFSFHWVFFVWNNDVYQPNKILMCTILYLNLSSESSRSRNVLKTAKGAKSNNASFS